MILICIIFFCISSNPVRKVETLRLNVYLKDLVKQAFKDLKGKRRLRWRRPSKHGKLLPVPAGTRPWLAGLEFGIVGEGAL